MRCALVLVALCLATSARADSDDLVGRPLVLARDQLDLVLTTELDLAPNKIGKPLSFAPDAWWGVTPRWTVGVIHSDLSVDRIAPGASVCVVTDTDLCTSRYHGGGLDARWSAVEGPFALAPRARLLVTWDYPTAIDPWKPALTLGALARWTHGRFAIGGDPYLQLGLAHTGQGNDARLFLPVWLAIQPTCRWELELQTGWNSRLAVWRDGYHVPLLAGVRARVTAKLELGAAVGFAMLLGPQNTPKERALFFTVGWRTPDSFAPPHQR